ncbi:MAG: fasciclin domain-containing protein [Bacteroidaceae bacterium]|nr:fasciclin domain-containing protein [Bacteroidaceae bacterium]
MKTKPVHRKSLALAAGCAMFAMGLMSSCDGYDLAETTPDWLGSSVYDYLNDDGHYTNMVRLIDDLNYKDVLAKTGSKTLFVANDEAFNRFYQTNTWGVRNYSELTPAQKKLLLFGSMINNSCQVAYLSSSQATSENSLPVEGDCMRRLTAVSQFDSVPVLSPDKMPNNPYWQYYKDNNKTIPCFLDRTTPPMVHFIEAFLTNKLINNDDCNFLFNYEGSREAGDANVNGIKMEHPNIKCSNGFVHEMKEVLTPLPNMAELIHQKANVSEFSLLLDRFCAPYYVGMDLTKEYNRIYNTNVDSVFEKRYFSNRSQGNKALDLTPQEGPVPGTLKFDPGWNQFYSSTTSSLSADVALQQNMGVMLVPSNEAMDKYWNEGAGKVLKNRYGSWENVPDKVVSKLLNVNMLNSFVNSVPSKFKTVLNDANDELGLRKEYVDSVFMACNGAVYLTNRVFNPVAYISVSFPALVNETMSIFYWGIEQCGYDVYLNSQNSYYSLFIPTNDALLEYIDPCSYGKTSTQLFRFHYRSSAQTEKDKVWASIWNYDLETQTVTDSISLATYDQIKNRLEDILNTHIVIGNVEDGNTFYRTKGGSVVKIAKASMGSNGMTVQGSAQQDDGTAVAVREIYDQSYQGNGKSYIIEDSPIMTTRKSVMDVLDEHEEFSAFKNLLASSELTETRHTVGKDMHGCASTNISIFNTFQYTVYVPSNEAIEALQSSGKLPTWEQVDAATEESVKDSLANEIETFIKYHIQDNGFYIGQGNDSGEFETSAYKLDDGNLSYYKLNTKVSNDGITVVDAKGNKLSVDTSNPELYNITCREYQYDNANSNRAGQLYTSSHAVVHRLNGALQYK